MNKSDKGATAQFAKRFRGYDPVEVDAHLRQLISELGNLRNRLERVERERDSLSAEVKEHRVRGEQLETTMAQAKKGAEEIKINAQRESDLLIAESELQAEKILGQAHNRLARIHDDITELRRQRAQFEVRLRSLVEAHLKLLDVESDRDRELAELEDKIKVLRHPGS